MIASGNVDFLVATGKQIPKVPFFTLHVEHFCEIPNIGKYKPEPNTSTNPQGQLLIAMIAAEQYNQSKGIDIPLYGIYVIGRLWFFVTMQGNQYAESLAFDATQDDIFKIFCMLKKVKTHIQDVTKKLNLH